MTNLHETLTNPHSIPHGIPIAFDERQKLRTDTAPLARHAMTRFLRHLALVALLAVLGALMLAPAGASASTAATGCDWHEMIDAAANDRQISMHTTACYERALAEVPADIDAFAARRCART